MNTQGGKRCNGLTEQWGRGNGCRRRLPVPAVSNNPHTQMQCFTSLSLSLSLSAMVLSFYNFAALLLSQSPPLPKL